MNSPSQPDERPNLLNLAKEVASVVTLRSIRWRSIQATADSADALDGRVTGSCQATGVLNERTVTAEVSFHLAVARAEAESAQVTVSATLELIYELSTAADVSDEQVAAFAQLNGVYNAWPYWRELSGNLGQRLGLPFPIVVPLWRAGQAARP